jgi:hypothetical protein
MSANIFNESRNWLVNAANIASVNGNVVISGNSVVTQIVVSPPVPTRTDVSYNFTAVTLAYDANARTTYIPNPYHGQMCLLTSSGTLQYYNAQYSAWSILK